MLINNNIMIILTLTLSNNILSIFYLFNFKKLGMMKYNEFNISS